MLDTIQYMASPLGNVVVKNPNISGIIHSIMRLVDACLGSAEGMTVIFCMTYMDRPTSTGSTGKVSGRARSSHRNELLLGITSCTRGIDEYRWQDRSMSLSGAAGSVRRIDRYSPIQMGNCKNIGPRHPMGFTPCFL